MGRFALQSGIEPLEIGFWRAALACVFFIAYASRKKMLKIDAVRDIGVFAVFGVFSLGLFFVAFQYSVKYSGAAMAAVLLYTAPAWVALLARIFFKDRLTPPMAAAIAMSLVGVACICFSGGTPEAAPDAASGAGLALEKFSMVGVLFGLLSGLLYSTHYIYTKIYLPRYTVYTIYGYGALFGALALLPFVTFASKSPADWAVLFFLGSICTAGAYMAYCEGMKRLKPTQAAVLATFEPVVATAAAWLLWGEVFSLAGWLGATLIIAAVLLLIAVSDKNSGC